jgi:hypothetical protein
MSQVRWTKSSRCDASTCLEVGYDQSRPDLVLLRDSKSHDGPTLAFTPEAFSNFLEWVKRDF